LISIQCEAAEEDSTLKRTREIHKPLLTFCGAVCVTIWSLAGCLLSLSAQAATYFPISDEELVRRSPVIVLAEVLEEESRAETLEGENHVFTLVTLRPIEVLKGSLPSEHFRIRLPGGRVGNVASWMPGVPRFLPPQRAVLFLAPFPNYAGQYILTELALSKFDVLEDSKHSFFAVRSIFQSGEERLLSSDGAGEAPPNEVRDLEAFLSALRIAGGGRPLPQVKRRQPHGALRLPLGVKRPAWVNIGGREPGDCDGIPCLFRWAWDIGRSPNGVVRISGTQSNLSDGSNGVAHVAHAIAQWTSIPSTDVRYSGPSQGGNVAVNLDVETPPGGAWSGPLDCEGGIAGLGGPGTGPGPLTFKGDGNYYSPQFGSVWIRKNVCRLGYPAAWFRNVVLHELGHTLCLGHPDQDQSVHSTTTPEDWSRAVMASFFPADDPREFLRRDDIEAIQYLYGTEQQQPPGPSQCVPDANTLCLSGGRYRVTTEWRRADGTVGPGRGVELTPDTGYFWFFDPSNIEMVVKVLNACSFASHVWVFAGGLTNVMVALTVTDTQTGAVKTYINPQGTAFQPVQDTSAFATCP